MHRRDKKTFKKEITKILKASTTELLYKGITGYHGEISSASSLQSQGCLAQLWSNALYVELMHTLQKK